MNSKKSSLIIILLSCLSVTIATKWSIANQTIQVGTYYRGSQYISIARKGTRLCYLGVSRNGATVASISADSKSLGTYRIHQFGNSILRQKTRNILLFGDTQYLSELTLDPSLNPYRDFGNYGSELTRCLDSTKPFFRSFAPTGR